MLSSDLLKERGISPRELILHEDSNLLILNKPSGIPSVPHSAEETLSMVGIFLELHPECANLGRGGLESGILHRLDTGTSGCLVFAKTQAAFEKVKETWKTPEVQKTYRALSRPIGLEPSSSKPIPSVITLPIGHDIKSKRRMRVVQPEWNNHQTRIRIRGKPLPARTRVLEFIELKGGQYDITVEIDTGVMHQIRVHLAHYGFPLVGDPVYEGAPANRLGLHAWKIKIPSSSPDAPPIDITAPLPLFWPLS